MSKPDPVYKFPHYTSVMHPRLSYAGDMDYPRAVVKAMAELPPMWDFYKWTHLTDLACTPEETFAIHEYGYELQRRAWAILYAAQHQRDTHDANVILVKARADRRRASPKESGALPSGQASLFEFASSEKSAVLSKQTLSQQQATSEREKPEDQGLVLVLSLIHI